MSRTATAIVIAMMYIASVDQPYFFVETFVRSHSFRPFVTYGIKAWHWSMLRNTQTRPQMICARGGKAKLPRPAVKRPKMVHRGWMKKSPVSALIRETMTNVISINATVIKANGHSRPSRVISTTIAMNAMMSNRIGHAFSAPSFTLSPLRMPKAFSSTCQ